MNSLLLTTKKWDFVNMNSPADLNAIYCSEYVQIFEYDRCRNGHIFLSKDIYETKDLKFKFTIHDMQDGVGIGLYCGNGAFSNYIYAAIFEEKIEIRIPNGVPNGDNFMYEGQKSYHVIASKEIDRLPDSFIVEFAIKNDKLSVQINDRSIIEAQINNINCLSRSGRAFIKALNENNIDPKTYVNFSDFYYEKVAKGYSLKGRVVADKMDMDNYFNVHLAGYSNFWTTTDEKGNFHFEDLPVGSYTLIAGKEGYAFSRLEVEHHGESEWVINLTREQQHIYRTEYPRADIRSTNKWKSLNGYWSFDFDMKDIGEKEMWFDKERHFYSRSINVPFPWSSLLAFGEEFLVDSDTLHHSNTFFNNADITGGIGWYYREFFVPDDFSENKTCKLNFNAISGISKVWVDGKYVGDILDSYNRYSFNLGKLKPGSKHILAVKVTYPFSKNQVCSGKQGFWFTDSPGIWQSVWIENIEDLFIEDIHIDYQLDFKGEKCNEAKIKGQINFDVVNGRSISDVIIKDHMISDNNSVIIDVVAPESNVYKFELNYAAFNGRVIGSIYVNDELECSAYFDCTLDRLLEDTKSLWIKLRKGKNKIEILKKDDKVSIGDPTCILRSLEIYEMPRIFNLNMGITSPNGYTLFEEEIRPICSNGKLSVIFDTTIISPELWDIGKPKFYKVWVKANNKEKSLTERKLGLRLIETAQGRSSSSELKQIYLNKRPIFIEGIMDQGYNPWGVYTYPYIYKKKGSMEYDITKAAEYGYNLIRMHIKDNEPNWYSLCDEKGILVWDEIPVNFYAKAEDPVWRGMYLRQLRAMNKKHGYHPSVVICSIFNESWGIEGWHERSPWEDIEAQSFIKEAAKEYKSDKKNVLVIDNSGYGKTSETDIIDHHSYPIGYEDSKYFWEDLLEQNYPGSTFNFFNKSNIELMKNKRTRELLQRNCSQNLKEQQYAGNEVQSGQPVIISEFIHTDGNEKYLKIHPKVSGYTRMNLASQENEDTSYMNQQRECRDFGYVNEDMEPLDKSLINSSNAIVIDYPRLSKVKNGDLINFDVYCSLWNQISEPMRFELIAVGINQSGNYEKLKLKENMIDIEFYHSTKLGNFDIRLPHHFKAAYLFAILKSESSTISQDYVQLEIEHNDYHVASSDFEIEMNLEKDSDIFSEGFSGIEISDKRELAWIYGVGKLELEKELDDVHLNTLFSASQAFITFEASSCENIKGVKITDEKKYSSKICLIMNDILIDYVELEDCPYDDRALFSRAATIKDKIFNFNQHTGWGYGYRQTIKLQQEHIDAILSERKIRFNIVALDNGLILYGNNMGRYGKTPYMFTK